MAGWAERSPGRRAVLVVEDFAPFRRVLARLLEGDGWDVWQAATAAEALRLLRGRLPDALVVDWCLGSGPDGLHVVRAARGLRRRASFPIVVVSAVRDDAEDEAAALASGAELFFSKLEVAAAGSAFLRHLDAACRAQDESLPLGGGHWLELSTGTLRGPRKTAVLNPQERRLLEVLARARGRLITHERLWEEVWPGPRSDWRHVLRNRVSTLRRKAGSLAPRLVCRRGEGFLLRSV